MPTCSVLHMARRPCKFFAKVHSELGAQTTSVDSRIGLSSHAYDLSCNGFHARATAEDYGGHMVVVGDWQRYDLEDVEAALARGLLIHVNTAGATGRILQKRIVCLDYGLDASLVAVDHACWDRFAAIAHTVGGNMRLKEVGTFCFEAPLVGA